MKWCSNRPFTPLSPQGRVRTPPPTASWPDGATCCRVMRPLANDRMTFHQRTPMFDLSAIQAALREFGFDGWLLYDFRGSNVLARRVLEIRRRRRTPRGGGSTSSRPRASRGSSSTASRPGALDHLPGEQDGLPPLAGAGGRRRPSCWPGAKRVAMEYSPRNANPYVSRVDAGTVELVAGFGVEVVSSGDLIQLFEATWDDEQWQMHLEAAKHTLRGVRRGLAVHRRARRAGAAACARPRCSRRSWTTSPRNGLVDRSSADRRRRPAQRRPALRAAAPAADARDPRGRLRAHRPVGQARPAAGRLQRPDPRRLRRRRGAGEVREDLPASWPRRATRPSTACARRSPPAEPLQGWQVDQAARGRDRARPATASTSCHRTGHSIGQETHGNGANMDNLETREERRVLPRTCFSIEPGIYLPEFGVRSEVNVFVDGDGRRPRHRRRAADRRCCRS